MYAYLSIYLYIYIERESSLKGVIGIILRIRGSGDIGYWRLCWDYMGTMLGLCWGMVGLCWDYTGSMLGLCWGMLGLCWGYVGVCWGYAGTILGLCWYPGHG